MDDSYFQGFDHHPHQTPQNPLQETHSQTQKPFVQLSHPRDLLSKSYSLQPDMLQGWVPKIPSIPMPLYYGNSLHLIKQLAKKNPAYKIVYQWKNTKYNTVRLHQENHYSWDKRNHFDIKWRFLQDAVQSIGKPKINDLNTENNLDFNETQYKFNSDFQSGNLELAIKVKHDQFDCYLRSDSNTTGHTNWYWFTVQNFDKIGPLKINICNLRKTKNLYGKGMAPYLKTQETDQWSQQSCQEISFVQKLCRYQQNVKYHALQFKYTFTQPNQVLHVAYCVPYTYLQLQRLLKEIQTNKNVQISNLGDSYTGLVIPLLKIMNHKKTSNHKKTVLMIGRTHPGESNSSWVVQGIIRELLSDSNLSKLLKEKYEFWIVPMLNVDGVVLGNFRCGAQGMDFNRCFSDQNFSRTTEVRKIIELAKSLKLKANKLEFVIDFHGHSQKQNCFFYGPEFQSSNSYYLKSRLFAKIFEEKCLSFRYKSSNFHIPEYKKTTVRSYMNTTLKIPMVFTLQVSNGVYESARQRRQYNRKDFESIGKDLLRSLCEYSKVEDSLGDKLKLIETKKSINSFGNLQNRSNLKASLTKQRSPNKSPLFYLNENKRGLKRKTSLKTQTQFFPEDKDCLIDSCDRFIDTRIQMMIEEVSREKSQQGMENQSDQSDFESVTDDFEEQKRLEIVKQVQIWTNQLTSNSPSLVGDKKVKTQIDWVPSSQKDSHHLHRQLRQSLQHKTGPKSNERVSVSHEKSQPLSIRNSHKRLTNLLKKSSSKPNASFAPKNHKDRTVIKQPKNLYELRATEMNSRQYSRVELNPKDSKEERKTEALEKENFIDSIEKPTSVHHRKSTMKFVESLAITSQSSTFHEKIFPIKLSGHDRTKQPIKLPKSSLWKSKSIKNLLRSNRFPFMLQKFA